MKAAQKSFLGLAAAVQVGLFMAYRVGVDRSKKSVKMMPVELFNLVCPRDIAQLDFTPEPHRLAQFEFKAQTQPDASAQQIAAFEYRGVPIALVRNAPGAADKVALRVDFYSLRREGLEPRVVLMEFLEKMQLIKFLNKIEFSEITDNFSRYCDSGDINARAIESLKKQKVK